MTVFSSSAPVGLLMASAVLLAACSTGVTGRTLETYYDPAGQFSADLPAKDQFQVQQPQTMSAGTSIVSGVSVTPPQQSTSSTSTTGITLTQQDQTIYRVLAVTTDRYRTAAELTQLQDAGAPAGGNLQVQQHLTIDSEPGLLTVTDYPASNQNPAFSVASGFMVRGPVGFWIFAIFPQGGWSNQQADFLAILHSFHAGVRPGVAEVPMGRPAG